MQTRTRVLLCALLTAVPCGLPATAAAQSADPQALRQEIEQLRKKLADVQRQYGERLNALEARLGTGVVPAPAAPGAKDAAQ